MSRKINQPINQVRLTNVAVVRMNKNGKRYEIACYRNKVMDYRNGLELDLDEVLQTERIFTNVSKGQFANHSDLKKSFATTNQTDIAGMILKKGQLQVSDLERQSQIDSTLAQISTWVAGHCVHPQSQRPYTISQIKHALGKQYQVQPHKPIKKQYLDCVKFLKTKIPIERAKMELVLSWQEEEEEEEEVDTIETQLDKLIASSSSSSSSSETTTPTDYEQRQQGNATNSMIALTSKETNSTTKTTRCVLLVDPSMYRVLDDLIKSKSTSSNGTTKGKLEILRTVVTQEGDIDLEMEIERKNQLLVQQQEQQQQQQQQQQQIANSSSKEQDDDDDDDDDYELLHMQQQKKNNDIHILAGDDDDDDDDEEEENDDDEDDFVAMVKQQQQQQRKKQKKKNKKNKNKKNLGYDNNHDDDDDEPPLQPQQQEDNNQQQQQTSNNNNNKKLSKKAKRRQRELEAEREAKIRAEQERQEERQKRLQQQQQQQQSAPGGGGGGGTCTPVSATTSTDNNNNNNNNNNLKSCNTCGGSFPTAASFRSHYKSDWHRFNQKLKLQGMQPVSEQEFNLCDAESFFG